MSEKLGFVFWAHFDGLIDLKSKSYRKQTPLYNLYTMLVSGIICIDGWATVQNQISNMIPFYNLQTDLFDFWPFKPLKSSPE